MANRITNIINAALGKCPAIVEAKPKTINLHIAPVSYGDPFMVYSVHHDIRVIYKCAKNDNRFISIPAELSSGCVYFRKKDFTVYDSKYIIPGRGTFLCKLNTDLHIILEEV